MSVKQHGHSERINESLDFKSVRFIIILLMLGHGLWLCVIVDAGEAGMNHLHQVNTYSIKSKDREVGNSHRVGMPRSSLGFAAFQRIHCDNIVDFVPRHPNLHPSKESGSKSFDQTQGIIFFRSLCEVHFEP